MISLTEKQQQAVRSNGRTILVEAGAGSGKTRVLVERIAFLVEEKGVAPDAILALTFTDKAASEMKTRIAGRLKASAFHSVLTFHRFCGRLLRENPLDAGVDPDFSMLDENRARHVKRSILARLVQNSDCRELERHLMQAGEEDFFQAMLALHEKSRHLLPARLSLRERTEQQVSRLRDKQWQLWRDAVEELADLHQGQTIKAPGTSRRMQEIANAWGSLPEHLRTLGPSRWGEQEVSLLQRAGETVFEQVGGNVAREVKPVFSRLALLKKDRLWEDLLFDPAKELRASIGRLLQQMDEQYASRKQEMGWCDFHDLEQAAFRLLSEHGEIRERYGRAFAHVLVDEYQDTNPVQQAILDLLQEPSREDGSLFLVGDPRQSIYRFRGADVRGFETMRKSLGEQDEHVELRANFRMNESLCAWSRDVCGRLFGSARDDAGEAVPESLEVVEILVPALVETAGKQEREADLLARRILQMGAGRYGDVAVLLQARTHQQTYVEALRRYGIPYAVGEEVEFWKRQEVQDLLHVLRVLADPEDGIALLGYLRGPLAGWADALLLKVAKPNGLTAGFAAAAHSGLLPAELERIREAKQQLARWRQELEQGSLADWLHDLLYVQGIEAALGNARLDCFVEWAEEAEHNGMVTLEELLQTWRQMELSGERVSDVGGAQDDETPGKVRVMTIHAAKGLEFPVVCLPDLTHPHAVRMDVLHVCERYGLVVKRYDPASRSWLQTLSYAEVAALEKEAEFEEKKRLFYVGITRAKERVILSGGASAFTEKASLEACSNWWDWLPHLMPALQDGPLQDQVLSGRGWLLRVVTDASVPAGQSVRRQSAGGEAAERGMQEHDGEALHVVPGKRMRSVTELVRQAAGESGRPTQWMLGNRGFRGGTVDMQPHEWGRMIHSLFEHLRADDTEEQIREKRLPAALAAQGIVGHEWMDEAWERVKGSVRRYRESELFREYQEARVRHHEMPFVFEPLPGMPVSGVIDALWLRADGGATVVDFKTHPCRTVQEMREVAERYAWQVRMYALAVERLFGWRVDRAGIYLTETGQFCEVSVEEEMTGLWREIEGEGQARTRAAL